MTLPEVVENILLTFYIICTVGLMIYGSHCYLMIFLFLTRQKKNRKLINEKVAEYNDGRADNDYPMVTFQLPVYNEAEVAVRLIRSAAAVDYPRERFEIQVVDDSTDDSRLMIDEVADELKSEGVDITVVRRDNREGFKAGALANAMKVAKGEFLAMFDSDFLVPANFLKRAIAQIAEDDNVACIQGRWEHLNRMENWLTRAQSVGIDGHFAAEQGARSYSGLCMNFNGTAGIWRASAIEAAGGWEGDTLTEDLDLSYRVQMVGYKVAYDFDLECPAEIPNNVVALKSQQRRWAKGSIETAIKLLPSIIKCKRLNFIQKIEAFLHLTHYFVAVLMMIMSVLTLPVLLFVVPKFGSVPLVLWIVVIISAMAPCVMYTGSGLVLGKATFSLTHFPAMLAMGTGLCLNNACAVIEAIFGYKTEFVRTPKSGSQGKVSKKSRYKSNSNLYLALAELIIGLYCLGTFCVYLSAGKYIFGFFIGAYAFGLLAFGCQTLGDIRRQRA